MARFDDGWNAALEALAVHLEGRVSEIRDNETCNSVHGTWRIRTGMWEWAGALESAAEDARSLKKKESPLSRGDIIPIFRLWGQWSSLRGG